MKAGAVDYIAKPFENQELLLTVERTLKMRRLLIQNRLLREELDKDKGFNEIIGTSKAIREVFGMVDKVAAAKATVLITGGKRHGQGTYRPGHPRPFTKGGGVLCGRQLHGLDRDPS